MRDADGAIDFLRKQYESGSTAWHNMCESLCRQAYGLPAHFSSANLHASAIPGSSRFGHEPPSKGDLLLMVNSTYGHIVIADPTEAKPWRGWSNDYGGRGKVTPVADLRDLVPWCGASSWYVADAWWSKSNVQHTHSAPPGATPDPTMEDDDMFIFKTHADSSGTGQGIGGGAHYMVSGGVAVQCDRDYGAVGDIPVILSPSEAMDKAFYEAFKRFRL